MDSSVGTLVQEGLSPNTLHEFYLILQSVPLTDTHWASMQDTGGCPDGGILILTGWKDKVGLSSFHATRKGTWKGLVWLEGFTEDAVVSCPLLQRGACWTDGVIGHAGGYSGCRNRKARETLGQRGYFQPMLGLPPWLSLLLFSSL